MLTGQRSAVEKHVGQVVGAGCPTGESVAERRRALLADQEAASFRSLRRPDEANQRRSNGYCRAGIVVRAPRQRPGRRRARAAPTSIGELAMLHSPNWGYNSPSARPCSRASASPEAGRFHADQTVATRDCRVGHSPAPPDQDPVAKAAARRSHSRAKRRHLRACRLARPASSRWFSPPRSHLRRHGHYRRSRLDSESGWRSRHSRRRRDREAMAPERQCDNPLFELALAPANRRPWLRLSPFCGGPSCRGSLSHVPSRRHPAPSTSSSLAAFSCSSPRSPAGLFRCGPGGRINDR